MILSRRVNWRWRKVNMGNFPARNKHRSAFVSSPPKGIGRQLVIAYAPLGNGFTQSGARRLKSHHASPESLIR